MTAPGGDHDDYDDGRARAARAGAVDLFHRLRHGPVARQRGDALPAPLGRPATSSAVGASPATTCTSSTTAASPSRAARRARRPVRRAWVRRRLRRDRCGDPPSAFGHRHGARTQACSGRSIATTSTSLPASTRTSASPPRAWRRAHGPRRVGIDLCPRAAAVLLTLQPRQDAITIGRDARNDVVLDDPRVSRRHALLRRSARLPDRGPGQHATASTSTASASISCRPERRRPDSDRRPGLPLRSLRADPLRPGSRRPGRRAST